MKSFTKWLFFVAIASMIALFPLQAQEHGEKGDQGKNGQGVKGEHHDGDSRGDKDGKKDEHKDGKKDEHKDGKKDEHKDGKKDGCDDEVTTFTVTLTVVDLSGTALPAIFSQTVATGGAWTFSVTLPPSGSESGAWVLGTGSGWTGTATAVDFSVGGNQGTVSVSGVTSAVDIVVYVAPDVIIIG
jgi:hypothetical protein